MSDSSPEPPSRQVAAAATEHRPDADAEVEAEAAAVHRHSSHEPPTYVVAVGASAGGLEALEEFFSLVTPGTGLAYVVIQHLSPDYASRMDELLSRHTPMPVTSARHGQLLERDHIYLGVARKEMIVSAGRLLLTERSADEVFSLPIDHFFRSLATEYGERAIGVILSGTGSDGTRGIREIHAAGGLTICQPPESAKFGGMPQNALNSGMIDLVLPPTKIPRALLQHAHLLPESEELLHEANESRGLAQTGGPPASAVDRILYHLNRECGIDFSNYKPTTVMRRIERRLQMSSLKGIEDYATYVEQTRGELNELYRDLLIGVTCFFRDEEAYEALRSKLVVPLVRERQGQDIRIWVAGCATGEEAYSMAILFHEAASNQGVDCGVKVFATDVHSVSLEVANLGEYSTEALASVSRERLNQYFTQIAPDRWKVTKELRTSVVFAKHNVLTDAPFTRLDLVSCRNMLIYFQPIAQKRVLTLFHFSLRTGGTLFLGSSETPGPLADEFEAVEGTDRAYRKRRDIRLPNDARARLNPSPMMLDRHRTRARVDQDVSERHLVGLYSRILSDQMPSSLLLDEEYRLLHTFGGAEKFLRVPAGRITSSALNLVDPNLRTPLSGALQQSQKQQRAVQYTGISIATAGDENLQVMLTVRPYADEGAGAAYLVQLEEADEPPDIPEKGQNVEGAAKDYVRSLEDELRFARENLQATVEELETSNEELQATNEELVASNEELQSTNEELHSVNEELYTVNTEHQLQIKELTELTSDLDNLFRNLEVGVLFLDSQRRIRKFTASMADVLHLEPEDVGRSFGHFEQNLDAHLGEDIARVLNEGVSLEREVALRTGQQICLLRIAPYRVHGDVDGVVISLVDITGLKRSIAAVERLSAVVAHTTDAVIGIDTNGVVTTWNHGAEVLFDIPEKDARGRRLQQLIPEEEPRQLEQAMRKALQGEAVVPYETTRLNKNEILHVSEGLSPLYDERQVLIGVGIILRDITRLKHAEESVRRAVLQRDQFIAILSHELRNPMMGIQSAIDLLGKREEDERTHSILNRQVHQMSRILDDLLDVTRMRRDKLEMRRSRVELRGLIAEVLASMQPRIEDSRVDFHVELTSESLWTHADPARLQQLLVNLLGNALKFTPPEKRVKLSLAKEGESALIAVADDGPGIAPDQLGPIFDPFSQGVDTPPGTGMGLGLALARGIARAHKGDVTASSPGRGCGSTFVTKLPLTDETSPLSDSAPPAPPGELATNPKRVLIVEDDEDNRSLIELLLQRRGHQVVGCSDGARGVELLQSECFDAALVDLGLPEKDGLQVARETKERARANGTKLIALTGHGTQTDRIRVHEAGFDEHLVKPVSIDILRRVLED